MYLFCTFIGKNKLTYLLTYSLTYLLIYLLTYLLIFLLTYLLTYLLSYLVTYSDIDILYIQWLVRGSGKHMIVGSNVTQANFLYGIGTT